MQNGNQKGTALTGGALSDDALDSSHSVLTASMYGTGQKGLQQFYTPEAAAKLVAKVIGDVGVLDPTAGDGSLLRFFDRQNRYGVEIDKNQVKNAVEEDRGYHAITGDIQHAYPLLRQGIPSWSGIVANPPFGLQWSDPSYRDGRNVNSTVLAFVYAIRLLAEDGQLAFIAGRDRFYRQIADLPEAAGVYAVVECDELFEGTTLPCVIAFAITPGNRPPSTVGYEKRTVTIDMLDLLGDWVIEQRETALTHRNSIATYDYGSYQRPKHMEILATEYDRRMEIRTKANREYDALLIGGKAIQWLPSGFARLALNNADDGQAFNGLNGQPITYFATNERLWSKLINYRDKGLVTIEPRLFDAVEGTIGQIRKERVPLYHVSLAQRLGFLTDIDFLTCKKDCADHGFKAGEDYRLETTSKTIIEREKRMVESKKNPGEYTEVEFEKQKKALAIRIGHHTILDGGNEASANIRWILNHFDLPDPGEVATKHPVEIARLEALVREVMEEFTINSRKWEEKNPTAMPFSIREFQVKDIARMLFKKGGLLSWEQGLGKTLGGLAFYAAAKKEGAQDALLIVTANDLIDQWQREYERFVGGELERITGHGQAVEIARKLKRGGTGQYIAHYGTLSLKGTMGKLKLLPTVTVREWQEDKKVKGTGKWGYYYWADKLTPEIPRFTTEAAARAYAAPLFVADETRMATLPAYTKRQIAEGAAPTDCISSRQLDYYLVESCDIIQVPCDYVMEDGTRAINGYIAERHEKVTKKLTSRDLCPECEADTKNGWNGAFCEAERAGVKCGYSHYAVKVKPIMSRLSTAFRRGVGIYDEIQMIQARAGGGDSKRSTALRGPRFRWFLGCTGTPIKNYIDQAFQPLARCGGFGSARFPYDHDSGPIKFESDFAVIEYKRNNGRRENRKALAEVTNLSMLWRLLASSIIRRRKEETGEPLVPKYYHEIRVPLGMAQAEQIAAWLKNFPDLFKEKYPEHPVVKANMHTIMAPSLGLNWKLDYACTLPEADPDSEWTGVEGISNFTPANLKMLELTMALVKQGRKVLLGSNLKSTGGWLAEQLCEKGVKAVHILDEEGNTIDAGERAKHVYSFQTDDVDAFCAGTNAIRLGHNLDAASAVVLHGLDFDYEGLAQFIDRIHRLTSKEPVDVFVILPTLTNQQTLTTRKWQLLDMKGGSMELALDGRLIEKNETTLSEAEMIRELMERGLNVTNECVDEIGVKETWEELKPLSEYEIPENLLPERPDDITAEGVQVAAALTAFFDGVNNLAERPKVGDQLDILAPVAEYEGLSELDAMKLAQNAAEMDDAVEAELAAAEAAALEAGAEIIAFPEIEDEGAEPLALAADQDVEEDETFGTCGDCGGTISVEEYNRTGTDDYCDACPELDTDPRTAADRGYVNETQGIALGLVTTPPSEPSELVADATISDDLPSDAPTASGVGAPSADDGGAAGGAAEAGAFDPMAQLRQAKELLDLGILDEAEFAAVKTAMLAKLGAV